MSDFKFPSIEHPSQEPKSLHTAVLQLKENVEMITGQRKTGTPFVMASSMQAYDDQLAELRKQDVTLQGNIDKLDAQIGYRKLANKRVTAVNEVVIKDLPASTKHIQLDVRLTPDTVNDTFDARVSLDNGATWNAVASSYGNILVYHLSSSAGVASGSDIISAEMQLCVGNVLQNAGIGYCFTGTVSGWFGTGKHIVYSGTVSWHVPTYILVGSYMGWRDQTPGNFNALKIYSRSGALFSGHVAAEAIG